MIYFELNINHYHLFSYSLSHFKLQILNLNFLAGLVGVINKVKGSVNGQRLKRETVFISVKPKMEANVITVNTSTIFRAQGLINSDLLISCHSEIE